MAFEDLLNSFQKYKQGSFDPESEPVQIVDETIEQEAVPQVQPQSQDMFNRTSELVKSNLVPGESAGIPQKTGKRSDILSSLNSLMGKKLSSEEAPVEIPSAPVEATPYQKQDLMGDYEKQMQEALQDRKSRMDQAVGRAAANDISNALMYGMGIDYKIQNTADNELKRMEDLKLKDFNERMGLSGKVLDSRKAEQNLSNMGDLNDPNSPITQALRKGAKEFMKGQIPDSVLDSLSGTELAKLNDEYGGIFTKIEDSKFRDKQFAAQEEDRKFNRGISLRELALREKQANEKDKEKDPYGLKLTPGEKKVDEKFAQDTYQKWAVQGNRNIILNDIEKLKEAERMLTELKGLTGPMDQFKPDFWNKEGKRLKDLVDSVTQKNLRETLGGQFAMIEGQQLLNRGLDRAVDEKSDNLPRVRSFRMALENAAKAKDAAVDHFEQKGTLKGLKSNLEERSPDSETKTSTSYDANQEAGIKYIMDLKKVSRDQAISALKKAGKL